jgi:hypothetical protein
MSSEPLHPLARAYAQRLDRVARGVLPRAQRAELVEEIRAHLAEAAPAGAGEAETRTALDRLGAPEAIVAEAAPNGPVRRRGAHEWFAIFGLLLGGLVVPLVGWFVGAILLWTSRAWTTRDKLVGTLLVPGGLGLVWILLGAGVATTTIGTSICSSDSSTITLFDARGSGPARHPARPVARPQRAHPLGHPTCTKTSSANDHSWWWILAVIGTVCLLISPIATSIYLAVRAQPRPA